MRPEKPLLMLILFCFLIASSTLLGQTGFERHDLPFAEITLTPQSLRCSDLDLDGYQDIIGCTSNEYDPSLPARIFWIKNNGDIEEGEDRFTHYEIIAEVDNPLYHIDSFFDVCVEDVEGDGDMDVLACGSQIFAWYENNGDLNFVQHFILEESTGSECVEALDLDDDGDLDIIGSGIVREELAWWENDGDENFTPHIISHEGAGFMVELADYSGDGRLDLLVGSPEFDRLEIFVADDPIEPDVWIESFFDVCDVKPGDVDGDGDMDIVAASNPEDSLKWWEYIAPLEFEPWIIDEQPFRPNQLYVYDGDGDGDGDVLEPSDAGLVMYWNNDWHSDIIDDDFPEPVSIFATDLDNDGDNDFVAYSRLGYIGWWENIPAPKIKIEPDTLDFGEVYIGDTKELDLTVSNLGNDILHISDYDIPLPEFDFSVSLQWDTSPRTSFISTMLFDLSEAAVGLYECDATIFSNDPANPEAKIHLQGIAVEFAPIEDILDEIIELLDELFKEGDINRGQRNSLTTKLSHVLRDMERERIRNAINHLQAFINEVWALIRSGRLPYELGREMIYRANTIIAALRIQLNASDDIGKLNCATIPDELVLFEPYPNPFNSSTTISFALPEETRTRLTIYDLSGRKVATLIDGFQQLGVHSAALASDKLATGMYIVRLKAQRRTVYTEGGAGQVIS